MTGSSPASGGVRTILRTVVIVVFGGAVSACGGSGDDRGRAVEVIVDAGDAGLRLAAHFEHESPFPGVAVDGVTVERLRQLAEMIEEHRRGTDDEALELVNRISAAVITPMEAVLDRASELVFVVDSEAIDLPLEFLLHRGRHLGLAFPVSFRIGVVGTGSFAVDRRSTALIIRDPETDPERSCTWASKQFAAAVYKDASDVTVGALGHSERRNLLVVSAHGIVGGDLPDHLRFGRERVYPADFASVAPDLVYFDACRLGRSRAFVEQFRRLGTQYYVAPILRNEAGGSSTLTMRWFLEDLLRGRSPERAMLGARRKVSEHYEADDYVKKLWRALAFRVYRLN